MDMNKNNLVLDLLNNCCYDIKEMVFDRVDKIKQRNYYRRNNYERVLEELKYTFREVKLSDYWSDYTFISCLYKYDKINPVYKDLGVGCKLNMNRDIVYLYDNDYYRDLDFILDCKCNTIIDIDNWDIDIHYNIKENCKYKYEKNYRLDTERDYVDNDNFVGVVKTFNFCVGFNLCDWLEENCYINNIHNDCLYEVMEDLQSDNFSNSERLKQLLYKEKLIGFNIFYN